MLRKLLLQFLAIFISGIVLAEGTKELRPAPGDFGGLLLMPDYSLFGIYDAPEKNQIKIRITSISETIYFGFTNRHGFENLSSTDNGPFVPNVPFRVKSPSGQIVYSGVMPEAGKLGHIGTWNEAAAGPSQLGNPAGYNALSLNPAEVGDYVIEFDPMSVGVPRLNMPLFDVTVAGPDQKPILGRLHSQGWQISTSSYDNPFKGIVYPYDGGDAVYAVDFNGMQPWVFVINFNSTGAGNTGDPVIDRQSKVGNHTYGEYEVFLNPPDPLVYPTQSKALNLVGSVINKDCTNSDFVWSLHLIQKEIWRGSWILITMECMIPLQVKFTLQIVLMVPVPNVFPGMAEI